MKLIPPTLLCHCIKVTLEREAERSEVNAPRTVLGIRSRQRRKQCMPPTFLGKKISHMRRTPSIVVCEGRFVGNTTKNRRSAIPHENFTFPNSFKTGQTFPTFCQGFITQILHVARGCTRNIV